ncbi:MAG: hypothetical protein HC828_05895 [Blastochloris sp.]|nr:hypothetical protein [Blastochloris sp.]
MTLEERVALLEQELAQLKHHVVKAPDIPWWQQIHGIFADTPAFDDAVTFGRQYRESQRSDDEDADVLA